MRLQFQNQKYISPGQAPALSIKQNQRQQRSREAFSHLNNLASS